jgi:hypothetical protein
VSAQNAMVVLAQLFAMMRLQLFNLKLKIFPLKTNLCHNFTAGSYRMLWEQISTAILVVFMTAVGQNWRGLAKKILLLLTS